MRIVVLDGYTLNPGDNSWESVAALGELTVYDRTAESEIIDRARGTEIILTNKTPITTDILADLPVLKFVAVLATGYNIVDVQAARQRGIPVSNVPEYSTNSVAEHVLALMFEFFHHPAQLNAAVHAGQWATSIDFSFWHDPLVELHGKCMGIIGFGRIGRRVGQLAHALGMDVLAYDIDVGNPPDYEGFSWASVDEVFARADVVTLHCPQTETNVGMVDHALLARMKPAAILINAARGGLVNEHDLAAALDQDVIAGAAVDVLSREPPAADNPLLHAKNCLVTPHVAWATVEARRRMMAITARNIRAFIAGRPINVVN